MTDPEYPANFEARTGNYVEFIDKLNTLLPGVEFEEPTELYEARMAILEALQIEDINPEILRSAWSEYATICEQYVDTTEADDTHTTRAHRQITAILHKALIFHEAGDHQRYVDELIDAETYAYNMYFDDISQAISREIDDNQTSA